MEKKSLIGLLYMLVSLMILFSKPVMGFRLIGSLIFLVLNFTGLNLVKHRKDFVSKFVFWYFAAIIFFMFALVILKIFSVDVIEALMTLEGI